MWGIMGQGSDFKAAGNRALKEWGALFERCDGGQGRKRGVGLQGSCFVHRALTQQRGGCDGGKRRGGEGRGGGRGLQCARERRGMGTERAAADAGGVRNGSVKGRKWLQTREKERVSKRSQCRTGHSKDDFEMDATF